LKIILSRKGFDSSAGGYPSPILPDGSLLSLSIPDEKDKIKYSELTYKNTNFFDLMRQLNINKINLENRKLDLNKNTTCHLDPDIRTNSLKHSEKWKGIFGQMGSAQTHLDNQNVKEGDLFLFFGWFRKTIHCKDKLIFDCTDKHGKHIIFGYLEIDQKLTVNNRKDLKQWMLYHSHANRSKIGQNGNTIYISKEKMSFSSQNKGYGIFNYNDSLVLTKSGETRSKWNLPSFFKSKRISYHTNKNWRDNYFQSAGRGQEFVIEESIDVEKWAQQLILSNLKNDCT